MGRFSITGLKEDSLKFKVPTLRNIEFTSPYMHDGRFQTLNQVLNHYIKGIMPSSTLSGILKNGINLSPNEKADVVAFLLTLSDKEFVFNPQFSYPKSSFQKNLKQADWKFSSLSNFHPIVKTRATTRLITFFFTQQHRVITLYEAEWVGGKITTTHTNSMYFGNKFRFRH